MHRGWKVVLVLAALGLVAVLFWPTKQHDAVQSQYSGWDRPPDIHVTYHRKPIPGGFLLVFDKPLVSENEGLKVSVLGIGRAKLPWVRTDPTVDPFYKLERIHVAPVEKMLILLNMSREHTLFGSVRYMSIEDSNETQGGDWRSNLCCGPRYAELALGAKSVLGQSVGARVQPIVCDLPPRNRTVMELCGQHRQGPDDCSVHGDVVAVDTSVKPDYGPVAIESLRGTTVSLYGGIRVRLWDWLIDNPAMMQRDWMVGPVKLIPERVRAKRYLSLRFYLYYPTESLRYGHGLYAAAYGKDGKPVLLTAMEERAGQGSHNGWAGMGIVESTNTLGPQPVHDHVIGNVDPAGPAAKAGVRNGDHVYETGAATRGANCIEARLEHVSSPPAGIPIGMSITRDGVTKHVTVVPVEHTRWGSETGPDPLFRSMLGYTSPEYEKLLQGIPYTGTAKTGICVSGKKQIGYCRLISCDPVPADFRPVRVALYVHRPSADPRKPDDPTDGVKELVVGLPDLPIPRDFWK